MAINSPHSATLDWDERAVVALVGDALRRFGYRDIEVIACEPGRPNLLACIGEDGARSLILSGHLDTKPPGDQRHWRTPPYETTIRPHRSDSFP